MLEGLQNSLRFFENTYGTKSYGSKTPKIEIFDYLVCKIHKLHDDVTKIVLKVLQSIMNKYAKFQGYSVKDT